MHISLDCRLLNATERLVTVSQGSYQILEQEHVLVGYGAVAKTREFNAAGRVVYKAQYGYSTNASLVASYCSYRQAWVGQPAAVPKAAVKCEKGQATLYISWNGATTVTNWAVFTGNSTKNLSQVGTVQRSGFETAFTLNETYQFAVAAAEAEGTSLGNSTTVVIAC